MRENKIFNKNDVICIIPARGGSKGLKNKNLRKVFNKKLIQYPIEYAVKSKLVGKIIVSTDSKEIAKVAIKSGATVPFIRPEKISGDLSTTEETLKHALLTYEKIIKKKFKICIFLTCTDIFREKKWIKQGLNLLKNNKKLQSVFVGSKTHKNFWEQNKLKKQKKWKRLKKRMKYYSSRQIRQFIVREDTGLFCASRADLWRKGKRIGDNVEIIFNNNNFSAIDIHDVNDLKLANAAKKIEYETK